jgi:phosphatidylserine/phosphatidylglycerophosphate/cardiolipin synthase-like enzyme
LTTAFQKEFQLMWNYSYDFPTAQLQQEKTNYDDSGLGVNNSAKTVFTSQNFKVTKSWTKNGKRVSSLAIEEAIAGANKTIKVATGHFMLMTIAKEILKAKKKNPKLDIKIVVDGKGFISAAVSKSMVKKYDNCVRRLKPKMSLAIKAITRLQGKSAKGLNREELEEEVVSQKCGMMGSIHVSRYLAEEGIDLRYKYYRYNWDYAGSPQMHHKYVIVDDEVISGSYNWSANAEWNTFENLIHFKSPEFKKVVDDFKGNFKRLWMMHRGDLKKHKGRLQRDNLIQVTFQPMALSFKEIDTLFKILRKRIPKFNKKIFEPDHRYWDVKKNKGE